jgi:hypothetical protein
MIFSSFSSHFWSLSFRIFGRVKPCTGGNRTNRDDEGCISPTSVCHDWSCGCGVQRKSFSAARSKGFAGLRASKGMCPTSSPEGL